MQAAVEFTPAGHILYDPELTANAPSDWFDPELLRRRGWLRGSASGRGAAWLFDAEGQALILRHYRRGGAVARLLKDRYPWLPLSTTRAWREWYLLRSMYDAHLPVPRPAAARVAYRGLFYRCDLITHRIPEAESLTQRLLHGTVSARDWVSIGRAIREVHRFGVDHADLNAHNLLLKTSGEAYLIDFDRGRRRRPGSWARSNLRRLRRSLEKVTTGTPSGFGDRQWSMLMEAYQSG